MTTTEATPGADSAPPAAGERTLSAAARLVLKGGLLLAAIFGGMVAFVWVVPEYKNYSLTSIRKHERLESIHTRKVVLIGGSNVSYGVDSTLIEQLTGCPAVNMGMNGYLGIRFMLGEAEPEINPGDIVVLAFEHDNFFKTVDGTPTNLLAVAKTNHRVIRALTWKQKLRVLKAIPFAAQQKLLRFLEMAYDGVLGRSEPGLDLIIEIESSQGFAPTGDLVAHLDQTWPYGLEQGLDASALPFETEAVALMADFTRRMERRGAHVMVSYTPVLRDYYERHQAALDHIHEAVLASPPLVAPSPPSAFVYDEPLFFDTVYHLNREGRELRTRKVVQDLQTAIEDDAACSLSVAQQTRSIQ